MPNRNVFGLFPDTDSAVAGADRLVEAGFEDFDVLTGSPYPEGAFGERTSHHRLYVFPFIGAICGLSVALLLTAGTQLAYPLVTGGKPILAIPAMAIICYEGTMLGAILFTVLGILFESRLPRARLDPYDARITEGHIGLLVTVPEEQVGVAEEALRQASAVDIRTEQWGAA